MSSTIAITKAMAAPDTTVTIDSYSIISAILKINHHSKLIKLIIIIAS